MKNANKLLVKMAEDLAEAKQNEMREMVSEIMEQNPGTSQQDATNVYLLNQIISLEVQMGILESEIDMILNSEDETTGLN